MIVFKLYKNFANSTVFVKYCSGIILLSHILNVCKSFENHCNCRVSQDNVEIWQSEQNYDRKAIGTLSLFTTALVQFFRVLAPRQEVGRKLATILYDIARFWFTICPVRNQTLTAAQTPARTQLSSRVTNAFPAFALRTGSAYQARVRTVLCVSPDLTHRSFVTPPREHILSYFSLFRYKYYSCYDPYAHEAFSV